MTGEEDIDAGIEKILSKYPIPFVCATMGKRGSKAFFDGKMVEGKPFLQEKTIETTGAGDTFCACMLHYLLEYGIHTIQPKQVKELLEFSKSRSIANLCDAERVLCVSCREKKKLKNY